MTKQPQFKISLFQRCWPLLVLLLSFLFCFKDFLAHFTTKVFLSLDSTVLYYPLTYWVHQHIPEGKLPLICDLAYHGAPIAAVSMAGVLSPLLWLFQGFDSVTVICNLIFLTPFLIFLFGTYFLGRGLGLSVTASLLLSFLWTYNGQRMAQLDHWNVAWACAFFPWCLLWLEKHLADGKLLWLLLASLGLGLNLLSGHPQLVFLEGLFFLFWIFLASPPLPRERDRMRGLLRSIRISSLLLGGAALFAAPLILFTLECHVGEGFSKWGNIDRFFHSWTPLNFITLVFPWFFGKEQYDREGLDYWWQYQFVEMQVAFSIAGLFFILLFLLNKHPKRRVLLSVTLFGLLMAFGKFFILYPLVQKLPFFSFFRDPARYWHLAAWALGLGAAFAWDNWFKDIALQAKGRKVVLWLGSLSILFLVLSGCLLHFGKSLLGSTASWFIQHLLLGDGLHTQTLASYMERLPEKLSALSLNLDPRNPRVFIPLLFLLSLATCVLNRKKWSLNFQRGFLLLLVFADLMIFRMPLGNVFTNPNELPPPTTPPAQNRSLVLNSGTVSPLPKQYAEMSQPNWNLVQGRANLAFDAAPGLVRYDKLLKGLGWFSWVYKNRDPIGFVKLQELLQEIGVDQIVSDIPLKLTTPFKTIRDTYPFTYSLAGTYPKAYLTPPLETREPRFKPDAHWPPPSILRWDETHLSVSAPANLGYMFLQKTYLSGWKASVNGRETKPFLCDEVLTGVLLEKDENHVELRFDPTGLRLGYFLSFLLSGLLGFLLLRPRLA